MTAAEMNCRPAAYKLQHRKALPQQQGLVGRDCIPLRKRSPTVLVESSCTFPLIVPQMTPPAAYAVDQPSSEPASNTVQDSYSPSTRRTLFSATASISSTSGGGIVPIRTNSGASSKARRSTSTRSGNSPTSYVALMRRQKGTVWCDRGQYEDPRLAAQEKAAKQRARMEVVGQNLAARTSGSGTRSLTGGVRSKVRHHGTQKASSYTPATLSGFGVPMRLSANEVDEGDSEDADSSLVGRLYYQRRDSGRSSLNSATKGLYTNGQDTPFSSRTTLTNGPVGSSPPPSSRTSDLADETPVPGDFTTNRGYYFGQRGGSGLSTACAGSEQRESSFGRIGQMPQRDPRKEKDEWKKSDELRRRGSVDDRSITMGEGRLFIANPDLSN